MLPVAAGRASASCSGGHPQAAAVSAADTNRPDTDPFRTPTVRTPTAVPEAAADSTASGAAAIQTPAAVAGCAAGCGRTAADPAAAVPAPWQRAHVGLARRCWSSGPGRHVVGGERLSGRADTVVACRTAGVRHAPARRIPATAAGARGHCGSGHAGQPAAEPSSTPAVSDRNRTAMSSAGRHARLTARSVAWCSASIWSAPDGSGLFKLGASSVQTDRDGTRRIVWMINGMIKRGRQSATAGPAGAPGCRVAPSLPWVGGVPPCYSVFSQLAWFRPA
jgi:hypothetical protein